MDPLRTKQYDHGKGNTKPCVCIFYRTCTVLHWKQRVVMMLILSSLVAPQVVITTTCGACSDDTLNIMTILGFQYLCLWNRVFLIILKMALCPILKHQWRHAKKYMCRTLEFIKKNAICKIIETFNDECPQFWNQQEPYRILPMW